MGVFSSMRTMSRLYRDSLTEPGDGRHRIYRGRLRCGLTVHV